MFETFTEEEKIVICWLLDAVDKIEKFKREKLTNITEEQREYIESLMKEVKESGFNWEISYDLDSLFKGD